MSADILTADGAAVTLAIEPQGDPGNAFVQVGYTKDARGIAVLSMQPTNASSPAAGGQQMWIEQFDTTGHGFEGAQVASTVNQGPGAGLFAPQIVTLGNGYLAVALQVQNQSGAQDYYSEGPNGWTSPGAGGSGAVAQAAGANEQGPPTLFPIIAGFALETSYQSTTSATYGSELQVVDNNGHKTSLATTPSSAPVSDNFGAHAFASGGGAYLQIIDNTLQYYANSVLSEPVTVPDEQAGAITGEAASMLANGQAAVTWTDAHAQYLAFYNPNSNSFTAPVVVNGGPTSDLHAVALADGGFVLSWMTGGAYQGEVFDASGAGGGVISLAGDAAGVDANGDFYTVGMGSAGQYQVQHYTISAGPSGGGTSGGSGSSVSTSDANYTAPDGVTSITLTGSNQTIHANNAGDTIWSDDSKNTLIGGTGADTFHIGRAGDTVTGGGGADVFDYAQTPWGGSTITDFQSGDLIDLTGLMQTTHDTGTDGFADGYLKIDGDGAGNAQIWANYNLSGNDGWWLVTTLDGVSTDHLKTNGDTVAWTNSGGTPTPTPTSVSTSDANYTAPDGVTSITLTGSNQTIHANNGGDAIFSDDTKNTLIGGTGADTFHIGRAGDTVTGGGGNDTFAYAQVPWGGSTITDFQSGDTIDLTGLMQTTHDTGTDGFADGYLTITSDNSGNAQVWANYNLQGNDNWWLVTTLNGVSTNHLQTSGDTIVWTNNAGTGAAVDTLTAVGARVDLPPDQGMAGATATSYTTISGSDEVAVAYKSAGNYHVTGYDLHGNTAFSSLGTGGVGFYNYSLASAGQAGFITATSNNYQGNYKAYYQLFDASGHSIGGGGILSNADGLMAFSAPDGAHLEWDTTGPAGSTNPSSYTYTAADVSASATLGPSTTGGTGASPVALTPYADTQVGSRGDLVIVGNQAQLDGGPATAFSASPTQVAAAGLANGASAAVAYVDNGNEYVTLYDAASNSFNGPTFAADIGGVSDTHVVALGDGDFVVSWMKNGLYKGEVFDATGRQHGGAIALAGDVAGVDSAGDLYTVGLGSNGHYQVQTYAINGSGAGQSPEVHTNDPNYTAPAGVTTIYLTGSNQTVHANNSGDTIFSDNSHNMLFGGTANDTFHIGRAGDTVTGGAGADTFAYGTVPWGGSTITDFNASQHDVIDLTGMLADQHYTGSDPFADGYLKYETDSHGNAQVWASYNEAGNDGWWLVTTLDGVPTSGLHYSGGMIT